MISVRVPATSANIGPGFDCMGLALQMYNTIEAEEISSGLEILISGSTKRFLPTNEKNLVYQSMREVFNRIGYQPRGLRLKLINNIPVTRGLGSSSACIVGGLFAANAMAGFPFTTDELIFMAAEMEGHPDNSTAAILGGLVIAAPGDRKIHYIRVDLTNKIKFAVFIPDFPLPTREARSVLPELIPYKDAVFNIGRAALLAASFATGNLEHIIFAMEDRLHQPFRQDLIPGMGEIFSTSKEYGAKGVYLSGAGPTIIAMLDQKDDSFYPQMKNICGKIYRDGV
ncbi:MAG: homoserine kinase [Clostridiaceae bacterium]|nr:homoserine kinase [Clostridiaceae bacterium]